MISAVSASTNFHRSQPQELARGVDALLQYVQKGDIAAFCAKLAGLNEQGVNLELWLIRQNAAGYYLMHAVLRAHADFFRAIVQVFASHPDSLARVLLLQNSIAQTSLHIASMQPPENLSYLFIIFAHDILWLKEALLMPDSLGQTAIHYMAANKNPVSLASVLAHFADDRVWLEKAVLTRNGQQHTALHIAALNQNASLLISLLRHTPANFRPLIQKSLLKSEGRSSPDLHLAARLHTRERDASLLKAACFRFFGTQKPWEEAALSLASDRPQYETPMPLYAVLTPAPVAPKILFSFSSDPELSWNELIDAARKGWDSLEACLTTPGEVLQESALCWILSSCSLKAVETLIALAKQAGVSSNLKSLLLTQTTGGQTAFHWTATNLSEDVMEALLALFEDDPSSLKAALAQADLDGATVFHWAAKAQSPYSLEALLRWGQQHFEWMDMVLTSTDCDQQTTFHTAAQAQDPNTMLGLIQVAYAGHASKLRLALAIRDNDGLQAHDYVPTSSNKK